MKNENIAINNNLDAAYSTIEALKEWISVSESQMCSTEVLSEQLPKINQLLESSMNDISTHFHKITQNTSEISRELQYLEEAIDIIKIGNKDVEIPTHLETLATQTSDLQTAKALKNLAATIKKQENKLHIELKKAADNIKDNSSEISQIVVGMQFQDRVSQNILITVNIMKTIVEHIEKEICISMPNLPKEQRKKLLNKDFAREILQQFRLGDLQLSFVNHLIENGYINNAEEIGFCIDDHAKKNGDDDIELF